MQLIFGKYEILHRLAIGGMGEVFYAVQRGVPGFERPVILKSLLPDLAQQEGFIEQFLDEARVAATLNHPNVVSIYEVGQWNGTYYLAMEYIRGRNLAQLMRRASEQQVAVPPLVAARVVRDAALGLDHAHRATDADGKRLNIVHRDVSPQNIMVRDDGLTKVVDFGIARASNRATRTATGAIKGKLAYMAPEQVLDAGVGPAVDQFALGIVLWEWLAQRRLFKADRDLELVQLVLNAPIPAPSSLRTVPAPLEAVVMRMLERDVARRFPSCAEVARALDLVLAAEPEADSSARDFMRRLGTEDLLVTHRPSSKSDKNFVIALKPSPGDVAAAPPDPSTLDTRVSAQLTGLTAETKARATRRRRAVGAALVAAVVLGIGGAVTATRRATPAPPPTAAAAPVQPVAAPTTAPGPEAQARLARVPPLRVRLLALGDTAGLATLARLEARLSAPPPVDELAALDAALDALEPKPAQAPAPARVLITSSPPGATVRLDGRPLGQAPQDVEVSPGEAHYILAERVGFRRVEEHVTLEPGEARTLALTLKPLEGQPKLPLPPPPPPEAPAGPGYLSVETTPWTKVSVDGEPLGSTPLFKKRLPAGSHEVLFVNEGEGLSEKRRVTIQPGETKKLQLRFGQ